MDASTLMILILCIGTMAILYSCVGAWRGFRIYRNHDPLRIITTRHQAHGPGSEHSGSGMQDAVDVITFSASRLQEKLRRLDSQA
jgi:hypothetical protein